ncbi:MAG: IS630 family transposase [Subdoligranulum sp.]|nr:IS630 family transposase [Subdoligranulum sp.]
MGWDMSTRRSLFTRQSGIEFDVVAAREAWRKMIAQCEAGKLVFLDESGINTNLSRRYGRAVGGERSVDKTPLNTPANTTILSSVRLNGETAYTIYSGGTTREKFLDYLKNTLIPTLHEGDIVVMDNMRTHHVKEVQTLLQGADIKLLYLPAYSPDLNPIENMWSKIKAIPRKLKIRFLPLLAQAVAEAFSMIHPSDCAGWFSAAGIPC